MAFKPMVVKFPINNDLKFWPEKPSLLNGGLNLVDKEYKLPENQTPKVTNMWYYNGELGIRWGQDCLNAAEVVEPICWGSYKYKYLGYYIKHCGTKLYKQDAVTGVSTSIYTSLNASKSSLFKFNGKIYLKQAGKYVVWDGTTATAVVPYIPTVIINRTPIGGGDTNENYNRLGTGFRNSFNGNSVAVAYTLTDVNLDATLVTCTVGGVTKVEITDFTVNRVTGVVTFSVAPATGTNNVIITVYKTVQTDIDSILNCLTAIPFGGQNDNRLFVGSNGTGTFYWTGITTAGIDPTYFAYNNYNIIGNPDDNITAFGKHYSTLCIHKVTGEIYGDDYTWNGTTGVFNTYPISDVMGCDCPDTIKTINSNSTWLNSKYGVCTLLGTQVSNQRDVRAISSNINPRLLLESNLISATSIDFGGTQSKYWICVNDKCYVWDYSISPYANSGKPEEDAKRLSWWYLDNINASSWIIDGTSLLYIKRDTGLTVKFHTTYDNTQFYDFGGKINAVYRYPLRMMGNGIYEFSVLYGWISVRGDIATSYTVTYFTSDDFTGDPATESIYVGSFSWDLSAWDTGTWAVMGPVFNWELSPYEKNIRYFGVEFTNTQAGTDMNISGMEWQYKLGKLIR